MSEDVKDDIKKNSDQEDGTVIQSNSDRNSGLDDATQLAQGKRRSTENKSANFENESSEDRTRIRSISLPIDNSEETRIDFDHSISRTDNTSSTTGASLTDAINRTNQEVKGLKSKHQSIQVINQRFLLASKLGVGGMGTVYKAKDLRKVEAQDNNPWVAVKLLNDAFKDHPSAFIALQREAQKSQKLAHPNIVRVYDFDRDGETVYMTMELLRGEDLNHVIKRKKKGFEQEDALNIIRQVGGALAEAHKHNIVHSDFKPGNIFYTSNKVAKVFDFGIARAVAEIGTGQVSDVDTDGDSRDHTMFDASTLNALTPAYASKEMHNGQDACKSDDVYALGCVAYEVLTGRHPYGKVPANKISTKQIKLPVVEGLKRGQVKALQRSIAIDRSDRYETVDDFLNDFLPERNKIGRAAKIIFLGLVIALLASGGLYYQQQQEILIKEQALLKEQQLIEEQKIAAQKAIDVENARLAEEKLKNQKINQVKSTLDSQLSYYSDSANLLKEKLEEHAFVSSSSDSLEWQLSVGRNISSLSEVYKPTHWFNDFYNNNTEGYLQSFIMDAENKFNVGQRDTSKWLDGYYQKVSNVYLSQARDKIYIEDFATAQKMIGLARQYDNGNEEIDSTQKLLTEKWQEKKKQDQYIVRQSSLSAYQAQNSAVTRDVNSCSEQLTVVNDSFTYSMKGLQRALTKLSRNFRSISSEVTAGNVVHVENLGQCIRLFGETDPSAGKVVLAKAKGMFPSYAAVLNDITIRPFDSCSPAFAEKGRRYSCTDRLISDLAQRGPELVVVESEALGIYSIGKYEVTQGEMASYCQASNECDVPEDKSLQLPATGYTLSQIDGYIKWLSQETEFDYRLPTYSEWQYAAKAKNSELDNNRNCQLNSRGLIKGTRLLPVDIGQPNNWGLIGHVGNAQEVVLNGSKHQAAGGSILTPMESCNTLALQNYSLEAKDVTGFRVLRKVELTK